MKKHITYISLERQKIIKKALDEKFLLVNKNGDIYRTRNGPYILKKPKKSGCKLNLDYIQISITVDNIEYKFLAHHIVWIYFNGFINGNLQINHKDGDKSNNHPNNLEIISDKENKQHALKNNLIKNIAENHYKTKLTNKDVIAMRKKYEKGNISKSKLSRKYNMSASNICDILNKKTWKYI